MQGEPRHDVYNALPDWGRQLCIDHVPTDRWLGGGLEVAAREVDRLIRVRGEDVARLGLLGMVEAGTLGDWLARQTGARAVA